MRDMRVSNRFNDSRQQAELLAYLSWLDTLSEESTRVLFPARSKWFRSEGFSAYTRMGVAHLSGQKARVLCLASVELVPEYRSQGFFTRLLSELQVQKDRYRIEALTIESVQVERLARFLLKKGFVHYQGYAESHLGNYALWLGQEASQPDWKPLPSTMPS